VASLEWNGGRIHGVDLQRGLEQADVVVIVTDHSAYDYADVVARARLVVDTRNATRGLASEKILKL
jgi:UDP-N-acetyl-D-glucosamine dehydrogenase